MTSPAGPMASAGATSNSAAAGALRIGVLLALGNVIIGALQPVITRLGAARLDPMLYCAGSAAVAALCCIPLLRMRGELGPLLRGRYVWRLFGVSMAGTVATTLSLTYGLRSVNVATAVLLLQTEPIYALIIGIALLGERPSGRQLMATAVIAAGVCSTFWMGHSGASAGGAVLIVATPLMWQIAHFLSLGAMPPLSPYCITGARFVYAGILLPAALMFINPRVAAQLGDPSNLALVAATGVVIYFLGSLAWYGAISRLSLTWTTALVVPGVPLLSVLFAALVLGEHASTAQWAGIAVAAGGIVLLVMGARPVRGFQPQEAVHYPLD